MKWEKKYLEKLTNELLDDWHRWRINHPPDEKKPIMSIIKDDNLSTKKDFKRLKLLIKKGYINLKSIQFPILLSSKGFYSIIDKDGNESYAYNEFFKDYNWKDRNEIDKCKKLKINIDQNKDENMWFLSEKGEACIHNGIMGVLGYKVENEAPYKVAIFFAKIAATVLGLFMLFLNIIGNKCI